jgi:diguanylate cyclase (GGDEF)-like protein/PAS domain S-box-containing protein
VVPLRTRSGGAVVAQEDITDQVRARARSDLAAAALASMAEAVVVLDAELVPLEWNDAFLRITGDTDPPRGAPLRIVHEALHPARLEQALLDAARRRRTWNGQFGFRSGDGRLVIASATLAPIVGQPHVPPRSVLVLDDVTELRAAQARLEYVAFHDELTGLPNRTAFKRKVDETIENAGEGREVWLLLVDVNLLKLVNENLGHEVGDRLLQEVARRLREVNDRLGPLARLSGDSFGLLLEPGEVAEAAARRIMAAFDEPLDVEDYSLTVRVSIGAASWPEHGRDFEDLQRCADMALQAGKRRHEFRFAVFQRPMRSNVERNLWTSVELPKALRAKSLYLDYQPMMRLRDSSTTVFEALARWNHPERGRVGPGEFVEAADEVGLTRELGYYVLDLAAGQLAAWRRRGLQGLRVASNVSSALLLGSDFLDELDRILGLHALSPGDLHLEITEASLMADLDYARDVLRELDRRGIEVAIDDFGTGYSSLAYLRELRADILKIAKPFVDRLPGSMEDRRVVEAIVHLARALGMRTVAEGVEQEEQLLSLRELGCDEVQGYLIARPMGPPDVERWVLRGNGGPPADSA